MVREIGISLCLCFVSVFELLESLNYNSIFQKMLSKKKQQYERAVEPSLDQISRFQGSPSNSRKREDSGYEIANSLEFVLSTLDKLHLLTLHAHLCLVLWSENKLHAIHVFSMKILTHS